MYKNEGYGHLTGRHPEAGQHRGDTAGDTRQCLPAPQPELHPAPELKETSTHLECRV